jgi:hypothetical protein
MFLGVPKWLLRFRARATLSQERIDQVQYSDGTDEDGRCKNYGGLTGADHKGLMASSGGITVRHCPDSVSRGAPNGVVDDQ